MLTNVLVILRGLQTLNKIFFCKVPIFNSFEILINELLYCGVGLKG